MIEIDRTIFSNRQTLTMELRPDGELWIRAPWDYTTEQIRSFVDDNEAWILKTRQKVMNETAQRTFSLEDGAEIPYLGGSLTLHFYDGKLPVLRQAELFLPKEHTEAAFLDWRLSEAELILPPKVQYWSDVCGLAPARLTFGNAKTRWGCMNQNGHMRLTTELVHLPLRLIDLVIVHELCHILHPNHSPAFHAEVRRFLPDADELDAALKKQKCRLQSSEGG